MAGQMAMVEAVTAVVPEVGGRTDLVAVTMVVWGAGASEARAAPMAAPMAVE